MVSRGQCAPNRKFEFFEDVRFCGYPQKRASFLFPLSFRFRSDLGAYYSCSQGTPIALALIIPVANVHQQLHPAPTIYHPMDYNGIGIVQ
jgi:hypothetical protein